MKTQPSVQSYSHQKISSLLIALGILILISGLIINPWSGGFYRGNIIDFHDVMLNYFAFSMAIGLLIMVNGLVFRGFKSMRFENTTVFLTTCMIILLSDRLLLAKLGLPLWMADMENHYAHRPNTIRSWGDLYNNKLIRINQYGHHDRDFPLEKQDKEFRGLIIGDSIAMGHGVTYEETFSNQLESILKEKNGNGKGFYKMISAGVQGYSTFQEHNLLKKSLVFKPDCIFIGFCMNDPIEPFLVDNRLGGVGLDYHGVTQTPSRLVSYLLNETGYGRLLQNLQSRNRSVELEKRWEAYSVEKIAQSSLDDRQFSEKWKIVLSYLDKMYDIAESRNIKIVLLIFPHTFQLMNDRLQNPQRILIGHAKSRNVGVIDFTDVFAKIIFNEDIVRQLVEKGFTYNEIHGLYRERIRRYFLDQDHYTVEGHGVVASQLYAFMSSHYFFERQ